MSSFPDMYKAVEEALDTIRPYLKADGGDIKLLEITDDLVVKIQLQGACSDCPMSYQTLKGGVEMVVRRAVPGINRVDAIDL